MRRANAGQRFGHRRRVMREVVVDDDAAGNADHFEPSLHAGERAQPFGDPIGAETGVSGNGNGGERIADVVCPDGGTSKVPTAAHRGGRENAPGLQRLGSCAANRDRRRIQRLNARDRECRRAARRRCRRR